MLGDLPGGEHMDESKSSPHSLIKDIHQKVQEMHPIITLDLPRMQVLLERVSNAQTVMSDAATRMSLTHEHAERRFSKTEERMHEVYEKLGGKGQMPITSHYLVVGSLILVAVLVTLYFSQHTIKANLDSISIEKIKKE